MRRASEPAAELTDILRHADAVCSRAQALQREHETIREQMISLRIKNREIMPPRYRPTPD